MPIGGSTYTLKIVVEGQDKGAGGVLGNLKASLGDIGKIAGGILVAKGIERIGQSISSLAKDAVDAASSLQTFRVGLETLVAREAVAAGAFENVGDALKEIGPNVDALQAQLRELSLSSLSVFSPEVLQNTFRLNMAYGASTEMAKDLTGAILNTGAALGLSNDMISRLNYNLAQALVAGDLTSINLRQLKLVGLDLAAVLRDELGMSIEEIRDKLKAGQLTLQEVSEAFMKYADENFAGAADRLRNTLKGAAQEIRNLFYYAGADLLTPSVEKVSGALHELFQAGKGVLDSGVLAAIGEELGNITGAAIEAGRSFLDEFGGRMAIAAKNAFAWGVNISTQLAAGIVEGAVAVLTAAMNFISNLLASWLGPGSPPKVAPDIDKWGAAAFSEFLHGFDEADWGIMDSISRELEATFRTLVDIGAMAEETLGPMMVSLSQDLSQALTEYTRTGMVNAAIFQKLREVGGQFGKELEDLARKQFSLVDATKAYDAVTKAFDNATDAEKRARDEAGRLLTEYEELVATRAPRKLLRQKQAEMDAANTRLKAAEDERKKLEQQKDKARERMELLRDQVRWQEKLLSQLQEMFQWQKKQEDLAKKAEKVKGPKAARLPKDLAKKLAGGAGIGAISMPKLDFTAMAADVGGGVESIREKLANLIPKEASENIQRIKDSLKELKDSWDRFAGSIADVWNKTVKPWIDKILDLIPPELIKNIAWATGVVLGFALALKAVQLVVGVIAGIFGGINWWLVLLIGAIALLKTAWDNNWGGIQDKVKWAFDEIKKWWETTGKRVFEDVKRFVVEELIPRLEDLCAWIGEKITAAWEALRTWWDATGKEIAEKIWQAIKDLWEEVKKACEWIKDKLVAAWEAVKTWWNETGEELFKKIVEKLTGLWEEIKKVWEWLKEKLLDAWDAVEKWWNKTGHDLIGKIIEKLGGLWGIIKNIVQGLKDIADINSKMGGGVGAGPGGTTLGLPNIQDFGKLPGQQFGGYWPLGGLARLHPNEMVLPLGNYAGINALTKAMEKAAGRSSPSLYIQTVNVYSNNAEDMLAQLQALTIPGV